MKLDKTYGHYDVYKKGNEIVLYNPFSKTVVSRYSFNEIHKEEIGGEFSTIEFEV